MHHVMHEHAIPILLQKARVDAVSVAADWNEPGVAAGDGRAVASLLAACKLSLRVGNLQRIRDRARGDRDIGGYAKPSRHTPSGVMRDGARL
jgi:hypothetical protein